VAQDNNFQNPPNPYLQDANSQNAMPQHFSGPQQQPSQQVQGQPISVGTPEAPVPVQSEAAPQAPEYGGEAIKRIEQQAQPETGAEQKEFRPQSPQPQQPAKSQPAPALPTQPDAPSFFGYKVPPQLLANPQAIMEQSGKGSTKEARTWLIVFLERMLRKQSGK